jgi:tetratricopeptide (TPR) repeat protein
MLKNYHVAHDEITQYETHVTGDNSDLIVDDSDHLLALDTSATIYLKLGNTDKAIQIFESKLAFLKTLIDSEEMRSDTLFKLGCLLAYKGQPNAALPLLNEALDVRKRLYDGTSKSVLESTWAVAATNQILGIVGKSIEEYSVILDKMDVFDKSFTVLVHNSAGKLFTENEKEDEAINCYRRALLAAETPEMEAEISLNLANALSSADDGSKPMEIYNRILETKLVEETKLHYWTQFDKSLLLIKMGEVASAMEILDEIADTTSELADDVRVGVYIASGNIALSKKRFDDALNCFGNALVVIQDSDVESIAQAKKLIGLTYSAMGQLKNAITSFERALVGLSDKEECKSANLLKADVWSLMSQVYQKMGDLPQAKRFGELGKHYFSSLLCKITTFSSISILSLFVQHCRLTSLNWVRRTLVPQEVSQIFNCFTWKRQKARPLMRARQFLRLQS